MNILFVEDDLDSRASLTDFIRELGHLVEEAEDGLEALSCYKKSFFHLIISDCNMPKMSGIELLREIKKSSRGQETDMILITGYGDVGNAVSAIKAGAYDYLLKPVNLEELSTAIERIAENQALRKEVKALRDNFAEEVNSATHEVRQEIEQLKKTVAQSLGLVDFVYASQSMDKIVEMAGKYHTDRSIPVLIQGETGTGKEVVARMIHYGKMKVISPFVDINCAAITPSLFESELFGYEPGSFTGGLSKGQKGKFDLASGGTLFLDEIGEIPLELQGKLLRVLQEREYYRVGGIKKVKTDVRLICATNQDLEQLVADGKFRKDLYYRLKVGQMYLPPLRQRRDDIIPLCKHFLTKFSQEKGKGFQSIEPKAALKLTDHSWPGNVRELRNVIEWAVFMFDDSILREKHLGLLDKELPFHLSQFQIETAREIDVSQFTLPASHLPLEDYVSRIIFEALKMHRGNKTQTAQYLGISRRTLEGRIKHIFDNKI